MLVALLVISLNPFGFGIFELGGASLFKELAGKKREQKDVRVQHDVNAACLSSPHLGDRGRGVRSLRSSLAA